MAFNHNGDTKPAAGKAAAGRSAAKKKAGRRSENSSADVTEKSSAEKQTAEKQTAEKQTAKKKAAKKKAAAAKAPGKSAPGKSQPVKGRNRRAVRGENVCISEREQGPAGEALEVDPMEAAKQTMKGSVPAIVEAMVKKAKQGSCSHAKALLEMTGAKHMFGAEAESQESGEPWAKLVLERMEQAEQESLRQAQMGIGTER